jgi:hypothetical protein
LALQRDLHRTASDQERRVSRFSDIIKAWLQARPPQFEVVIELLARDIGYYLAKGSARLHNEHIGVDY